MSLAERKKALSQSGELTRDTVFTDALVRKVFPVIMEDYERRVMRKKGTVEVFVDSITPKNLRKMYKDISPAGLTDKQVDEIRQSAAKQKLGYTVKGGVTKEQLQGKIDKLSGVIKKYERRAKKELRKRADELTGDESGLTDIRQEREFRRREPATNRIDKLLTPTQEEEDEAKEEKINMKVMFEAGIPYIVDPNEGAPPSGEARKLHFAQQRKARFESFNQAVNEFTFPAVDSKTKETVDVSIGARKSILAGYQKQMEEQFPGTPTGVQTFGAIGGSEGGAKPNLRFFDDEGVAGRPTRAGVAALAKSKMGDFQRPQAAEQAVNVGGRIVSNPTYTPISPPKKGGRRVKIVKSKPKAPLAAVPEADEAAPKPRRKKVVKIKKG